MALDPNLAEVLTNILKNHAQNVSNSNKIFRQTAAANNNYVKNIVGQIHQAISYNNKKISNTSSTIKSVTNINNNIINTSRDTVSLINNSTSTIYQILNEIKSANALSKQSNNNQNSFFNILVNSLSGLASRKTGSILESIGAILTRGRLKGTGAKILGGTVAATGLGAAAYVAGSKIKEEYDRVKASARESAEAPGPSTIGVPSTERPSGAPSSATPSPPPSGTPSSTPPSDATPTDSPNVIGGYTSIERVPKHGGSKFSREFGFYKDTPQGRVPIRGGRGHAGLDIPIKPGQPYKAHLDGVIIKKGFDKSGYGHYVDVRLEDGTIHRFSHLGTNDGSINPFGNIQVGKPFKKGDILGYGGYSGNAKSNFPHVHHEVWVPKGEKSAEDLYKESNRAGESRAGMPQRGDPRTYWTDFGQKEKERLEKERLEKEKQSKPDASQTEPSKPDASKPTSTDSDRIPNPYKPGAGLKDPEKKPFGMVLSHMSGFTPGSPSPEGGKVQNTAQELEFMKKGMYKDPISGIWKSKTGFGYHSAVASNFVNPATGETLNETDYNKLSEERKKQFIEQAKIHEIRPYSDRPYQAGPLNPSSYGIATVGKLTPAKIEAMKNHLAKMYADGLISEKALKEIYGHGELQKHGGRGHMQPGGEGAPMAKALRQSLQEILKRGEDLKKQQAPQIPGQRITPVPGAPIKTDAIPQPQTQSGIPSTINSIAAKNEAQETKPIETATQQPQNEQGSRVNGPTPSTSSSTVDPVNKWTPTIYNTIQQPQPSITV